MVGLPHANEMKQITEEKRKTNARIPEWLISGIYAESNSGSNTFKITLYGVDSNILYIDELKKLGYQVELTFNPREDEYVLKVSW